MADDIYTIRRYLDRIEKITDTGASGYTYPTLTETRASLQSIESERSALVAERDQLREALEHIRDLPDPLNNKGSAQTQCYWLKGVARAALAGTEGARDA